MVDGLQCYRCGESLGGISLPWRRLEPCPNCSADLHCCEMCVHFAPNIPKQCEIDETEEVRDKGTANFCDFFKPAANRFKASLAKAQSQATEELAALFRDDGTPSGTNTSPSDPDGDAHDPLKDAEDLFR